MNNPTGLTISISVIYLIFLLFYLYTKIKSMKKFGVLKDVNGIEIPGISIGLKEKEFGKIFGTRVTDDLGRYRFIAPEGNYELVLLDDRYRIVDVKNNDIVVKEGKVGIVKKDIFVERV